MPENQLTFERLDACRGPRFEAFYAIYATSLSPREQKPKAIIAALPDRQDYAILLLCRGDRIIGFSVMFVAAHARFCLLEYMAIHPDYRSLGYGGILFEHAFGDIMATHGPVHGLIEVDADRDPCPDLEIRRRRQRFYRRLGCRRIDGLAYQLPLPGEGPPPAMDLMVYSPADTTSIVKSQLEYWLKTIYRDVYSCDPNDPRIGSMLTGLPDPVRLV